MVPSPQSPILSPPSPQLTAPLPYAPLTSLNTPYLIINDALLNAYKKIAQAAKYIPIPPTAPTKRTKYVYVACVTITGTINSDQTGASPVVSITGNKYLFVHYDYD